MDKRFALCLLALPLLIGCDDGRPSELDAGGGVDAGPANADGGGGVDAGGDDVDGGGGIDGGGGGVDGGMPLADVGLTFSGCSPDFGGQTVVVSSSDSIAVTSVRGSTLVGSIQLALEDPVGTVDLSTQHRVDTGTVINLVIDTSWTNIAMDSAGVLGGTVTDPIGGQLVIRQYDEAAGLVDVQFNAVTLQNPSTGTVCQIDGQLQTFGLSL